MKHIRGRLQRKRDGGTVAIKEIEFTPGEGLGP